MKFLKLKELLKNEGDEITVQVVGKKDPVKKEFNGISKTFVPLTVLVNGESYEWETSDDQRSKIKENGCGATFVIRAYKSKNGYIGFSYVPKDDVSLNYGTRKQVDPVEAQDEIQDKISRGAAWNNAFQYCLKYECGEESFNSFLKRVSETAKQIAPAQKAFVNGEAPKSTLPNKADSEPPVDPKREDEFELPF